MATQPTRKASTKNGATVMNKYRELARAIDALDFDTVFRIKDGEVVECKDVYAPNVYHDEENDISIDGDGWQCITGISAQYGYGGAVMHPSEHVGPVIAEVMADYEDVVFSIVVVTDLDEDDTAGWAIAFRE